MKKLVYFAALALVIAGTSCEKNDIGGTATEAMAGQWYVTVDGVDENGNLPADDYADFFGDGQFIVNTYNTAANDPTKMFISDLGDPSIGFTARINSDQNALTFATAGDVENASGNANARYKTVNITGGKILLGAAHQKNGSVCDSIVFYVSYPDDPFPATNGFAKYRIRGIRYSGLAEND